MAVNLISLTDVAEHRKRRLFRHSLIVCLALQTWIAAAQRVNVAQFGVSANTSMDATPGVAKAIAFAKTERKPVLVFPKGRYEFWPERAAERHYFISNHDAVESRAVAMPLEGVKNFTIDGQGSTFIFHGAMLPISIVGSQNVIVRNLTIDYATTHVLEAKVIRVGDGSVDLSIPADEQYDVENGHICAVAEGWKQCLGTSQEFDSVTKAIAWNTHANLDFAKTTAVPLPSGDVRVSGMPVLPAPGNRLILWNRDRPDPAIWTSESSRVLVNNVNVLSAMGMGFLAQKSSEIHLDGFRVELGKDSRRYVTSEADAVHCSSCRGSFIVENGLFENMLDDGINVHGNYLRITDRVSPDTVRVEWVHRQTFGFRFAAPGEHIQFVKSDTLFELGSGIVKSVVELDDKHVKITFAENLPAAVQAGDVVDNTDWQPSVVYRNNIVRRNRSRGSVFKTTRGVFIEGNTFDHLSGPAVLLIADAKEWFESRPASDVVIEGNHFIDQVSTYGPAPITIAPRVDMAAEGEQYNVSGIEIRANEFSVFQRPLLVANSVSGLVFSDNTVLLNTDYKPFLVSNIPIFSFQHVRCIDVEKNRLPWPLAVADVNLLDTKLTHIDGVTESAKMAQADMACSAFEKTKQIGGKDHGSQSVH